MTEALLLFQFFALMSSQSLMDLGTALLALWGLVLIGRERRWSLFLREKELLTIFAGWIVVIAVGLALAPTSMAQRWSLLLEFRWVLELLIGGFLLSRARWKPVHRKVFYGILVFMIVTGFIAFFMRRPIFDDHFRFVLLDPAADWPEGLPRMGGLFNNPMPFAQTFGPLSMALLAWVFWTDEKRRALPLFAAIGAAAMVVLSLTRGVWIAQIATFPLLFARQGWKRVLSGAGAVVVVAAIAAVAIPPVRDRIAASFDPQKSYDSERWTLWQANLRMFERNPLFGVGYGLNSGERLVQEYKSMGLTGDEFNAHAHNQVLHFLAGTGLFGAIGYVFFFALFISWSWALAREGDGALRALPWALLLFQLCFLVGGMTESNFSIAKNRMALIAVWAWVLALRWKRTEARV